MRPRRLRPMIVGVPLEPGVGGLGGAYDIDAEGVDGGGPDPIGDGVVADGAGAVDAASPGASHYIPAYLGLVWFWAGLMPVYGADLAWHDSC